MKKLLAILFCLILVFSTAAGAFADVIIIYEGWSICSIESGSAYELRGYSGDETDVTLLNYVGDVRVIALGANTFYQNNTIVSVTGLPYLQIIREYAFLNAAALKTVTLPYSVYSIERGAFYGAQALESINLQDTDVSVIKEDTFRDTALTEIELPTTCRSIGNSAFAGCSALTKAVIPSSVTEIADSAFNACDNLVIYAESGSYAIEYAKAKGIPYVVPGAQEVTFMLGDADGDNAVTIVDVTQIQRVLAELVPDDDGMIALRGLVTEDLGHNELTIMDATRIQRWLAEYAVDAPIGEIVTKYINPTE